MKKLLTALILAILLTVLLPLTASAAGVGIVSKTGDGIWEGDTWKVQLYPAEEKVTTVELYNSSSYSLDVEVTIAPSSLDEGNVTFELSSSSFAMPRKSYLDVILTAKATGSATPGQYSSEFVFKFEKEPSSSGGGGGGGASPLNITNLEVLNVTETSVDITWDTNRNARSRIILLGEITTDANYIKDHSMTLTSLEPCTEYTFEVKCYDKYGEVDSKKMSFTTLCEEEVTPPPTTVAPTPTEPTTPPVEPTIAPPDTTPPEEEESVGIQWYYWLMIDGVILIFVGLAIWWLLHRRRVK